MSGKPKFKNVNQNFSQHLQKKLSEVNLKLNDLTGKVKLKEKEQETVAEEISSVQKKVDQIQKAILTDEKECSSLPAEQQKWEEMLSALKKHHQELQQQLQEEQKKEISVCQQVETLSTEVIQLTTLLENTHKFSNVTYRATEKANKQQMQLTSEKYKQDLYKSRLADEIEKIQNKVMYTESQYEAKVLEYQTLQQYQSEIDAEVQALQMEMPQIIAQWQSSVNMLDRGNEVYKGLSNALRLEEDDQKLLQLKIRSASQAVRSEKEKEAHQKERNVKLKKHVENETKLTSEINLRIEKLHEEKRKLETIIREKEEDLEDSHTKEEENGRLKMDLQKEIEKAFQYKAVLEENLLDTLRDEATYSRESKTIKSTIKSVKNRLEHLELDKMRLDKVVQNLNLQVLTSNHEVALLQQTFDENKQILHEMETKVSEKENEYKKGCFKMNEKQVVLTALQQKLSNLLETSGGIERSPVEKEIVQLEDEFRRKDLQCQALETQWLDLQSRLMELSKKAATSTQQQDVKNKELFLMREKKYRLQADINQQEREIGKLDRKISNLRNDLERLSNILCKETELRECLEKESVFMENELVQKLKESELECFHEMDVLDGLQQEVATLKHAITGVTSAVILWEKRLELAEKAKHVLASEAFQKQLNHVKSTICQKQMYLDQIVKEQDKVVKELEKTVIRHDALLDKLELQSHANIKHKNQVTLQRRQEGSLRQIRLILKNLSSKETELSELEKERESLQSALDENQQHVTEIQSLISVVEKDCSNVTRDKYKTLILVTLYQHQAKYLEDIKEGKKVLPVQPSEKIQSKIDSLCQNLSGTQRVVEKLSEILPVFQDHFRRIVDCISCKEAFSN